MKTIQTNGAKRNSKRMVVDDLRYTLIADVSAKQSLAIRHKPFECLFFVENIGPGVVEVQQKEMPAERLTQGGRLVGDARQEVLIDVVEGEFAKLILQPVCGGTDGLSSDVVIYFTFLSEYGYYRD